MYFSDPRGHDARFYQNGRSVLSQKSFPEICPGDKIGVAVDTGTNELSLYHNGTHVYSCSTRAVAGAPLYPCALLGGSGIEVRIQPPSYTYTLQRND